MNKNLMKGTFWLTFSNLLCKFLGVIYLIPWLSMMGTSEDGLMANALYNVAYLPYGLFLMLGTVGFPNAIAKKIAIASKENDDETCQTVFKSTNNIMYIIGILSAVVMFLVAPMLAAISPLANQANGIIAIRSLCLSLVVIPILSGIRGYFQGKNDLKPYGVSLILEQFIRIVVILVGTFYFRVLTDGTIVEAVVISTVASFFGGIAAIIYMFLLGKKKGYFTLKDFAISTAFLTEENKQQSVAIIKETIPFIFVGSVITITQLIDQVTIKPIMRFFDSTLSATQLELLFSKVSVNPNKLTAILISMIGTVAMSSLPLLSSLKKEERSEIESITADSLNIAFLLLIPATCGMMILASPLYTLFFGYDNSSVGYFQLAVGAAMFMSLFTILSTMLQSLNHHAYTVRLTLECVLSKLLFQVLFLRLFGAYGLSLSTGLAFLIAFVRGYLYLCREYQIMPLPKIRKQLFQTYSSTILMSLVCVPIAYGLSQILNPYSKSQAMLTCLIVGVVGIGIFAAATLFHNPTLRRSLKLEALIKSKKNADDKNP